MNRLAPIIRKFKRLSNIGEDILISHKHIANSTQYDMKWKHEELASNQKKQLARFNKLADNVSDDWKKFQKF